MDNKNDSSFARRSGKYRDNSNLGGETGEDINRSSPQHDETKGSKQDRASQEIPEMYPLDEQGEHDEYGRRKPTRRASSAHRVKARNKRREVIGWIISVCLAIAVALFIRAFVFEIILVDGESMYPTLYTDERVAVEKVTRYGGMPKRGDIIIVEYPNLSGTFVKRAIGLPGETVEVRNSTVYINGQPLEEDYINPEPYNDMAAVTVPENYVFVMGDNRAHSLDSRTEKIGAIPHSSIVGHGLFVIWPLTNMHGIS